MSINNDNLKSIKTKRGFTIGVVSRFDNGKRIDLAIRCFESFRNLNGKGELIIIGDGPTFNQIKK